MLYRYDIVRPCEKRTRWPAQPRNTLPWSNCCEERMEAVYSNDTTATIVLIFRGDTQAPGTKNRNRRPDRPAIHLPQPRRQQTIRGISGCSSQYEQRSRITEPLKITPGRPRSRKSSRRRETGAGTSQEIKKDAVTSSIRSGDRHRRVTDQVGVRRAPALPGITVNSPAVERRDSSQPIGANDETF